MDFNEFLDLGSSRNILSLLSLAGGMLIFCGIILFRVDVWAQNKAAEIQVIADHDDFEMSRYRRNILETMGQQ